MSSGFQEGDLISVAALDRGVLYSDNATYECEGDGVSFSSTQTPISYTTAGQELSYCALYPAQESIASLFIPFTFVGEADQSSEANFRASDLLVGEASATVATSSAELLFSHKLSYISFIVSGSGLSDASLSITASVTTECDIAAESYASTGSAVEVEAYKYSTSSSTKAIFGAIVAPQTVYGDFATLKVGGKTYKYGANELGTVTRLLESGEKYTFDISLSDMSEE